jgi:hypothetical protein
MKTLKDELQRLRQEFHTLDILHALGEAILQSKAPEESPENEYKADSIATMLVREAVR